MRSLALVGFAALMLVFQSGPVSGQKPEQIVITNATGHALNYRYRATYNDGNGSDKKYFGVNHDAGKTIALPAAGVPSYRILIRLPDGSASYLGAQQGPFQIRVAQKPFGGTKVIYVVLDANGQNVPLSAALD